MALAANESSVVSGPYLATWDALDLGHITVDGFNLNYSTSAYDITADITGEGTNIDSIFSGLSATVSFTLEHWNAPAVEAMLWWFGEQSGDDYAWGTINGPGLRMFDAARPLVLTACHSAAGALIANGPNQTIDPLNITFPRAILQGNSETSLLLATKPRFIPVTLTVFPVNPPEQGASGLPLRVRDCTQMMYWSATRNPDQVALRA